MHDKSLQKKSLFNNHTNIYDYKNALFWTLRNQRAKWNDNYYMKEDLNKKSADFLDIVGKISIFFLCFK